MIASPKWTNPSDGGGASVAGAMARLIRSPSFCVVSVFAELLAICSAVLSTPRYSSSAQLPIRQGTE